MNPTYSHTDTEASIYALWENSGALNPDTQDNIKPGKSPYTILLPPPNANASLHAGHAMYEIEDILIRAHRMMGHPTLWLPGTDHAGFETQFVYEKYLAKKGQSRFQFDRETLYNDIFTFVQENSGVIFTQLKQLGFSCDWSRATFTLDDHVVQLVYDTFKHMVADGLVYRDNYIVNYSPKSGTAFSELEIEYIERNDPLYFIKFGPLVVATVRPETKFRDIALVVNPKDKRYINFIGQTILFDGLLGPQEMRVYADDEVDMEFGTGVMKVTPAHDAHDFALGKKLGLPVSPLIDFSGRMDFSWFLNRTDIETINPIYVERAKKYHGKKVQEARKLVVQDLVEAGLIDHIDTAYVHNVAVDYKTGGDIEPLVMPNWFIKTPKLAQPALKALKDKKIEFVPKRFEKEYVRWLQNIRDWPISRQIVWGIRIPAWYDVHQNPNLEITFLNVNGERVSGKISHLLSDLHYSLSEIRKGLQQLKAPIECSYSISGTQPSEDCLPETDTFDTWFSSGQWPLATLQYPDSSDFIRFYPTQVLDTMWDILFFWVSRMVMLCLYRTQHVPFKTVYLHSMVTDAKGAKMSKSKGNVINPIDLIAKYGADALRMALVAGSAPGNPIALSEAKVKGYRNFSNKLWNICRFIVLNSQNITPSTNSRTTIDSDVEILNQLHLLTKSVNQNLEKYRFSDCAIQLYDFVWNAFASSYLESTKTREDKETYFPVLLSVFTTCLKLLHPFMPFVTESMWQELKQEGLVDENLLLTASWPTE